ncbi:MAG TPA: hypothetical protein VFZ40_10185 [Pyrinomonadaceae bacterium]
MKRPDEIRTRGEIGGYAEAQYLLLGMGCAAEPAADVESPFTKTIKALCHLLRGFFLFFTIAILGLTPQA